jgi:hypothetical protein
MSSGPPLPRTSSSFQPTPGISTDQHTGDAVKDPAKVHGV